MHTVNGKVNEFVTDLSPFMLYAASSRKRVAFHRLLLKRHKICRRQVNSYTTTNNMRFWLHENRKSPLQQSNSSLRKDHREGLALRRFRGRQEMCKENTKENQVWVFVHESSQGLRSCSITVRAPIPWFCTLPKGKAKTAKHCIGYLAKEVNDYNTFPAHSWLTSTQ